jgi:hypothetical protein
MAVNLSPVGGVAAQFFTNTGAVLTGGKIYTYAAGTTTPAATYTSSSGSTAWANPIVLDAAGRVPSGGEIWLTDGISYKFVLKDSTDVLIATYDNISGINSNFVAYTNSQEIQTATAGQTVFTLTTMQYQPGTNSLSVFVDGVNQYGSSASYAYVETSSTVVTFNSGLHVGAEVKFTSTQQQGAGVTNASQITYVPAGTGAIPTNVQAKLRESVSVLDFGADPTGVIDSSDAVQAAVDSLATNPGTILFPAGTYKIAGKVSCYTGQNFISEGASLDVSTYNGIFLSYNEADTFDFTNYYPPTLMQGFKVLGKVSTVSPNTNFVFTKINRTPYVTVRDCSFHYAACAVVLGESILCYFDNVHCNNPVSTSFFFALGNGGFGPNGCTLMNCEVEEQKYPCSGISVANCGINVQNCYLESMSSCIYLNGGDIKVDSTGFGLRTQTGSTGVYVEAGNTVTELSISNCSITFGGRSPSITPIDSYFLNANSAISNFLFTNNNVQAIHDSSDTSTVFALKALTSGVINANTFNRNAGGTNTVLFSTGAGATQMYSGSFSDNKVVADFGSTFTFNASNGTGSYVSAYTANNTFVRVDTYAQIKDSIFINNTYYGGTTPALNTVASASTITVNDPVANVSGTTTISTINSALAQITLVPTGLWATNTGGNIALGSTAVVGKALTLSYNSATSKWYPSY